MPDLVLADPRVQARRSGVIKTPEVDLGYETFGVLGEVVPLIAVNGGPGLSHAYMMMNDLWERIGGRRLVVLYDQRGTGASKTLRPGASQDMAAQVADLEAVRIGLGLETVALVGDSYGGMVCMAYAAAHPQHVNRLVLSNSGPPAWKDMVHLFEEVFPDVKADIEMKLQRLDPTTEVAKRLKMHDHFRMLFHSPARREAYMERMGDLGYEPAVGDAVMQAIADIDLWAELERFEFPTLVLAGRHDMNVAPLTAWRMAQRIPGACITFFEESGHLPAFEEPEVYFSTLEKFLDVSPTS